MSIPTIVVVEANPALGLLFENLLGDAGYEVDVRPDEQGTFQFIQQAQPDLVIMDLWLRRRGDGLALLKRLGEDARTRHIPVLVCSADTQTWYEHAALLHRNRCSLVAKPFDSSDLLARIKVWLDQADALWPVTTYAVQHREHLTMTTSRIGDGD